MTSRPKSPTHSRPRPATGERTEVRRRDARPKRDPLVASLMREDPAVPFGSAFFLSRLGGFVRERCPTPADGLPIVLLHLADGEVLDVCHVIGLARPWVALAVHDERDAAGPMRMRTVVVPYGCIVRVTLRADTADGIRIGFEQTHRPLAFPIGSPVPAAIAAPSDHSVLASLDAAVGLRAAVTDRAPGRSPS